MEDDTRMFIVTEPPATLLSICPACGALVRGQLGVDSWRYAYSPIALFACQCGAHWAASEGYDG